MLKNAIKNNYQGGHIPKSGQKHGGKKFGAEGAQGKILGQRGEYTSVDPTEPKSQPQPDLTKMG